MTCPRCGAANSVSGATCTACGATRVGIDMSVLTASTPTAPRTPRPRGFGRSSPVVPAVSRPASAASSAGAPTGTSPGFARDATRYLCAAVQTDSGLNNAVVRALIDDKHHALAFSPGVDTATVLKYALAARTRRRTVDALLGVEVLLGLYLLASIGVAAVFWGFIVLWLTVHTELWLTRRRVLRPKLRSAAYDAKDAPEPSSPRLRGRVEEIAALNLTDNVTVGTPGCAFPGFGTVDLESSRVVDISRPAPGRTVRPFTVHDLYSRVERDLGTLGLPGIRVAARVLIDGRDLSRLDPDGLHALLPDPSGPPASHVDESFSRTLREDPTHRARCYLAIRVTGWSGEVVGTHFVRFHRLPAGDLLSVTLSRSLLPPLREEFHRFDCDEGVIGLLGASLRRTPRDAVGSLPRLAAVGSRWALLPLRHWLEADAIARRDFDFAPRPTVRELAALPLARHPSRPGLPGRVLHHRYFQEVDREMYDGLVEGKLAAVLADFLAEHGVAEPVRL